MDTKKNPSRYSVEKYKDIYMYARAILLDAERFDPSHKEDVERAMWISAMVDTLSETPMRTVKLVSDNRAVCRNSEKLIRKSFPRKKPWDEWSRKNRLQVELYASIYEGICNISRDADDFNVFTNIQDEYIKKCEWICAIHEVMNNIYQIHVKPLFEELNMEYDWKNFYDNYYFELE